MGKAFVIKGVNYAASSIPQKVQKLSWIGISDQDGTFASSPNGRFIPSGLFFNTDIAVEMEFITDTRQHSIMLPCSRYSNQTIAQAWIQADAVEVSFGGYGVGPSRNTIVFHDLNLWDGETHTIYFDNDMAVVDEEQDRYENVCNTVMTSDAPLYLDCSSLSIHEDDIRRNSYAQALIGENIGSFSVDAWPEAIKMKRIKIWGDTNDKENSLLINAVPAKRLSDGAVGFYNLVNGEFLLRNDGSTPVYGI